MLDVLETGSPIINPLQCILLTTEVANAVRQMHASGLLHNDVAARNVLLSHDGARFRATLADFGMVSCVQKPRHGVKKTFRSEAEQNQFLSTHPEIAPEIILHGAYQSVQSDIYALGHLIRLLAARVCNNDLMSILGNLCHSLNVVDRPNLDYVIMILGIIADTERTASLPVTTV